MPTEACNCDETKMNKYGGLKKDNEDFWLQYKFQDPIKMEGYGIQTADEFLNPEEWSVYVDILENGIVTEESKLVSYVDDFKSNKKWDLKHFKFKVP